MNTNYIPILQKAKMNERIEFVYSNTNENFTGLNNLIKKVIEFPFSEIEKTYLFNSVIQNIESLISAYISDMLRCFLLTDLSWMDLKKVNVKDVLTSKNMSEYMIYEVDKYINEINYMSFSQQIILFKKYDINITNDKLINEISEIIATRNIIVHNKGIVNDKYINQSNSLARSEKGNKIKLDIEYINASLASCGTFILALYNEIPNEIKTLGKANVFRLMWETSLLEETLPFTEAWKIKTTNSISCKPEFVERFKNSVFSHSETDMVNFFVHIYNRNMLESGSYIDLQGLLYHFKSDSNEMKMVYAWIENPFFF